MDLGLDKLVEMVEERVGRWAGTVALWAVLVGVVSWGVHALEVYIVLPGFRAATIILGYFRGVRPLHISPDDVLNFLQTAVAMAVLAVGYIVTMSLLRRKYKRDLDRLSEDGRRIIERCQHVAGELHAEVEAFEQEKAKLTRPPASLPQAPEQPDKPERT